MIHLQRSHRALKSISFCARVTYTNAVSFPNNGDKRRTVMKLNMTRILFGVIFFAALIGTPASAQARSCSLTDSAGNYGFTLTGVVILGTAPAPIAAIGRATLDAGGMS